MTSCIRFLQCAGFLFDSPSWDGPEKWIAVRNQDVWKTFQAVLSLCQSEKIEFLFITGDLFEQEYVRKETVEQVARSFSKLEGTRIFITPGKRDPLIITSAYRLTSWPSNVHIFSSELSSVRIPSHNVTIYGMGWTAYQQEKPFLDGFQIKQDGTVGIMLLHAEVDSEKNTEGFIPIRQDQIASSNLTYLALGHQETWSGIHQAEETFWADCGTPEARGFHDNGEHGVLLGEIKPKSCQFKFQELGQRKYIEKDLMVQALDELEGVAAKLLAETCYEERQENLFRIKLAGGLLDVERMALTLQNLLETKFRFLEVLPVQERLDSSPEELVSRNSGCYPTLAQIYIDKLQKRLDDARGSESYEYWELVQKIGLTALGRGRGIDEN